MEAKVMALAPARVSMPAKAKKGDIIEVKALVRHPMETGYRVDNVGEQIPRNIITLFTVIYGGVEIFRMDMYPAISANPFISFAIKASVTGELVFTWTDDLGQVTVERKMLTVT
jgi:sulfur-oxidizing protein SoxZ